MVEQELVKTPSFETLLRREFERRHVKNPSYSLRAFARSMSLDASSISKILNGKRKVGKNLVRKLAQKLGMSEEAIQPFLNTLRFDARRRGEEIEYRKLASDIIQSTVDWYHNAILLLTEVNGFKPDFDWISEQIGIHPKKVKEAVDRLVRLGLLSISDDGIWKFEAHNLTTLNNKIFTNSWLQLSQKKLLEKAQEALYAIPVEERDQTSMTFSFCREDLPLVREYIKRFRRRLDGLVAKNSKKDSVYSVSVSLFPLTKIPGVENA